MKKGYVFIMTLAGVVLVLLTTAVANAAEPNNVGELLRTNGFEWFFGTWETVTDANLSATATFDIVLDGYAFSCEAKVGQSYEYAGLVYYDPAIKTIINTGADNRGRVFEGTWEIEAGKLLINLKVKSRDGTVNNYARYLSKVNDDTMQSVTYTVFDGRRSTAPLNVLEFKRIK